MNHETLRGHTIFNWIEISVFINFWYISGINCSVQPLSLSKQNLGYATAFKGRKRIIKIPSNHL